MPINATVTAKAGPGLQNTAALFAGVKSMTVDPDAGTLTLTYPDQSFKTFSLDGVTVLTTVISGKTYTVTVS